MLTSQVKRGLASSLTCPWLRTRGRSLTHIFLVPHSSIPLVPCLLIGLGLVQSIGYFLVVSDNDNLQSLNGLSGLASVGEDVYFRRNRNLRTLDGAPNLGFIGGSLYVQDNPSLQTLGGLGTPGLRVGGLVAVENNPAVPQGQVDALVKKGQASRN